MDRVADSFFYPFRPGARRSWLIGILLLVLLPIGFIPLLGYAVAVVRRSALDPAAGPPAWRPLRTLLLDGILLAFLLAALALPFALLLPPLVGAARPPLATTHVDPLLVGPLAAVIATGVAALPCGILLLVLMPAATARYALSGAPADLFNAPAALRLVRSRFGAWNLVVVAIVTSWAIGLAAAGLLLVGALPGVFYALLVSSHATGSLADA